MRNCSNCSRESAKAFLQRRELSVATLVEQLRSLFDPRFSAKPLQLQVEIDPPELVVFADLDKLLQALRNLLENAWRYTPAGGQVMISAARHNGQVEIAISNSGPGIAVDDLPFIFERFFRADRSRSREQGGAGIGLSIVKELIEAHDGEVGAESSDAQTRIWVRLPIPN